jgi:integrase
MSQGSPWRLQGFTESAKPTQSSRDQGSKRSGVHQPCGQPMDISRARKRFIRILNKAGVSGHCLYDLRHTFATALLAKNAPITI